MNSLRRTLPLVLLVYIMQREVTALLQQKNCTPSKKRGTCAYTEIQKHAIFLYCFFFQAITMCAMWYILPSTTSLPKKFQSTGYAFSTSGWLVHALATLTEAACKAYVPP
jgi:hypothetical protein